MTFNPYIQEIFSNDTIREFTVENLQPYSMYRFKVQVCNSIGCVDSDEVSTRTLPAGILLGLGIPLYLLYMWYTLW